MMKSLKSVRVKGDYGSFCDSGVTDYQLCMMQQYKGSLQSLHAQIWDFFFVCINKGLQDIVCMVL